MTIKLIDGIHIAYSILLTEIAFIQLNPFIRESVKVYICVIIAS